MGRAKGNVSAAASDAFGAVLGSRRGSHDPDRLDAAAPSERARARAEALLASARRRERGPALAALSGVSPERLSRAPLLAELAHGVARELAWEATVCEDKTARELWQVAGVKLPEADQLILVHGDARGTPQRYHLWMQGCDHGWLPSAIQTECGRRFSGRRLERVPRGSWEQARKAGMLCPDCAQEAWQYPETDESADYSVLRDSYRQRFIDAAAQEGVLVAVLKAAGDGEDPLALAREAVSDQLVRWAAANAHREPAPLRRVIGARNYGQALRTLPPALRKRCYLPAYASLELWEKMLRDYLCLSEQERASRATGKPTIGADESAMERARRGFVNALIVSLRHYNQHPELRRPDARD